ncbi:MAG: sigma 54-interacting transcriptional regulator [Gemmatimonadetes bacterium]|nr:sigma 54-interacting transcriptional regulator [Gemmatimonadota bacterium]MBT6149860.1 sigma 54-interacting transcriptional regulator [Gemmatimonadota bacterium]MBT7858702.1 sigma 54-interacting transcriptional regulator [Gemmatimonadota bacterium]
MAEELNTRLAELEARAQFYQTEYEYLCQKMPNAMFVVDPARDRIVEANDAACRLLGYGREQLLSSMTISDIHPHELEELREFAGEIMAKGAAASDRLSCLSAAGRTIPVTIHGSVFEDQDGRQMLRTIVVDMGHRHAFEQVLEDEVRTTHDYDEITGGSPALRQVLDQVQRVAPTDSTVLILGETGTGKELICRAIHHDSMRSEKPLVKLNCAAIPSGLIESELFGHEKGAFTGAIQQKRGRFELAHGGTIFLDEIGDIPLETQPKLLRLLQEREFERVGGSTTIQSDVRVIAATHRNLEQMVADGSFRQDLFYRLNVFPLTLPPLRERREDIPLLAQYFSQRMGQRQGLPALEFSSDAVERLLGYHWPGNIRELENIVERAVILCDGGMIDTPHISVGHGPATGDPLPGGVRTLQQVEQDAIIVALQASSGKISGPGGAAEMLGLKPSTLESRMKKLGIDRTAGS